MLKKTQNTYGWQAVQNLIDKYLARGGEVIELVEGSLGAGTTICFGEGLKTTIIQERFVNCWSSTHTIRMYNKMPKKYDKMIADWYNKNDND
jgi:hypothetical protein